MRRRSGILCVAAIAATIACTLARAGGLADLESARAQFARGRWAAAESLATTALTRFDHDPAADSSAIAQALFLLADSRARRDDRGADSLAASAAGRSLAIRTRRPQTDPLEVAATHALLGRALAGIDRPDSALGHARRALEIRRTRLAPNDTLLAQSHRQIADHSYVTRDFRGVVENLERALAILESTPGTERTRADDLTTLGMAWSRLDQREKGRAIIREALDLLDRTYGPGEQTRWEPLNLLAGMELNDGNAAPALHLYRQALAVLPATSGEESVEGLTLRYNMTVCLQQLGDHEAAKQLAEELLPAYLRRFGPDHPRTLSIRQNRAFANIRLNREDEALAEFREIAALYEQRGGPLNPNHLMALREVAYLTRRQGLHAEARATCEKAIRLESASERPFGPSLLTLQMMYISILEVMDDRPALDRASLELTRIAETHRLASLLDRSNLEHWKSRIDRACGRPESAWEHALESERLARERVRHNLESAPDRRALQLTRRQQLYFDLVLDLAALVPGRFEPAWDRLVRNRGQVAGEMARRRLPPDARADTGLAGAQQGWIDAQRRYAQRVVQAPPRDSAGRIALDRLRAAAEDAEQTFARRLANRGSKLPATDPGLAELRARLDPRARLVGLVEPHAESDTARVLAFVAGPDGPIRLVDLGRSQALAQAIDPWLAELATPPTARAGRAAVSESRGRELGRRVRTLTWDRLTPLLAGARDVFLVADGPLVDLPWQALPEGESGYLVETLPRVHRLQAERDLLVEPASPRPGTLLAVGAPTYSLSIPGGNELLAEAPLAGWLRDAAPCAAEPFRPLPGTAAEARAVAAAWTASGSTAHLRLGAEADEARFKREAPGSAVLHLATHGFVLQDSCPAGAAGTRGVGGLERLSAAKPAVPAATKVSAAPSPFPKPAGGQRVWLAFAGANRARDHRGDENEGLLTAEEVVTLDLEGTDWVVLSACHSGVAEGWYREGTRGMREAFHFAGARSVIASQWAIADDATGEWMQALYAARLGGTLTADAAVETASRTVLASRRAAGRSTHPFYWAAFAASGR